VKSDPVFRLARAKPRYCAPPKVLVANSVQTKYLLQESPAQGRKRVFNFIVRVCDAEREKSMNCKDSVVLENVIARSVY
jgi:hypothetical protein